MHCGGFKLIVLDVNISSYSPMFAYNQWKCWRAIIIPISRVFFRFISPPWNMNDSIYFSLSAIFSSYFDSTCHSPIFTNATRCEVRAISFNLLSCDCYHSSIKTNWNFHEFFFFKLEIIVFYEVFHIIFPFRCEFHIYERYWSTSP